MDLKEKIKKEIDAIPEDYLPQLQQYLNMIKKKSAKERHIKTLRLKGRFDEINIRKIAYE